MYETMRADRAGSLVGEANNSSRLEGVLADSISALDGAGVRYLFIGGVASSSFGRPRSTRDIDLLVMPEDAETVLAVFARNGFDTEQTDPSWLYKAFKEGVLVDVIFRSKGEIYLDQEMYEHMKTTEFHGRRIKSASPEDLLIIKAVAHSEVTPNHWHDAIALLSYAHFDWNYLIRRARKAPRRILSLLLYAQSSDIAVPGNAIHELYHSIYG